MKILAMHTYTDCENKYRSLRAIGHEVVTLQYDARPHSQHGDYINEARALNPDAIVMIGAIEQYHGRPVPHPDILKAIKTIAPFVHVCDDAGDPPWWPMLEVYEREQCFTVQVSIDGAFGTPVDNFANGLVLLTPIDHRPFNHLVPWDQRNISVGMVGGRGHVHQPRYTFINALIAKGLLDFRQGPEGRSYDEMAQVMSMTKITYNYGMTGSMAKMHVKGRVVEAGFAGCALLETIGSPLDRWFEPGKDFFWVESPEAVERILVDTSQSVWQQMAAQFGEKVRTYHHPQVFWNTVFDKVKQVQ